MSEVIVESTLEQPLGNRGIFGRQAAGDWKWFDADAAVLRRLSPAGDLLIGQARGTRCFFIRSTVRSVKRLMGSNQKITLGDKHFRRRRSPR